MRISLLSASISGLGGAEAMVRMLANQLGERGHEVQVISLDPGQSTSEDALQFRHVRVGNHCTRRYAERENHGPFYKGYWQLRSQSGPDLLGQVSAALKKHRPEIIHTHKVRGFPRDLWAILSASRAAPLVHTCHDIEVLSPLHALSMTATGPVMTFLLDRWSAKLKLQSLSVSAVTSPSRFMLGLHLRRGFFGQATSEVISNFPDLGSGPEIFPLQMPRSDESLKLAFLGRLVKFKGILSLCEAIGQAVEMGHDIQLHIAGDGELRKKVLEYCEGNDRFRYLGVVEGASKRELLAWAHVVVTPAQSDETFCLVAAEAICAGRPVLTSNRGGLPEVVRDGETGWVCDGDSTAALLRGLERVKNDRGQLEVFSGNCVQEAGKFSAERTVDAYQGLYERLIDSAGAG